MFLSVSCTISGMTGTEWKRLGELIVRRRIDLGMKTTKAFAAASGLTPRMLGDIEKGRRTNYAAGTKAQIENTLRWAPGSIAAVLAGSEPTALSAEELEGLDRKRKEFGQVYERVGEIYDELQRSGRLAQGGPTVIKMPDLTPMDLLILARDTPPEERTEAQWALVYEAEARIDRIGQSVSNLTEELFRQRQIERNSTDAISTDSSTKQDAPPPRNEDKKTLSGKTRPTLFNHPKPYRPFRWAGAKNPRVGRPKDSMQSDQFGD